MRGKAGKADRRGPACFGGSQNATLFSQAQRGHLSDLAEGVPIGTRTDKGTEIMFSRTLGKLARLGLPVTWAAPVLPSAWGGEWHSPHLFLRERFSEGSGPSTPPLMPAFLPC